MKKVVDKSQLSESEIITREFMRRFSAWNIPIEKLDITLEKLPNEIRQSHYLELQEIIGKAAFKREIDDWLRRVSQTLAMGIHEGREITEIERQGLRICMLEIKNFENTLERRAMLASSPKPLRSISDKI